MGPPQRQSRPFTQNWLEALNAFVDISQYFTVFGGFRILPSKTHVTFSASGASASQDVDCTINQYELGLNLKYPIKVNPSFTMAPRIGFDYIAYLSGQIKNLDLSSDGKTMYSPMLVTLGSDLDFGLGNNLFVRIPVSLGFALNAKLSDSYYSGAFYDSSSNIQFGLGVELGTTL